MTEFLKHPFWQRSEQFFTRRKTILWLCVLLAVFIAVKQYRNHLMPGHAASTSGTHYNNFLIYKHSFWHLLENKNLYLAYPSEYVDHYLYGPAFSALFAPLAILPNFLGILLWCLLNTVVFWIAIRQLPVDNKKQCLIFWIALNSLYTTLVNLQINSLLSAFIIMSYAQVHRKNDCLAPLFLFAVDILQFCLCRGVLQKLVRRPHHKRRVQHRQFFPGSMCNGHVSPPLQ